MGETSVSVGLVESTQTSAVADPVDRFKSVTVALSSVAVIRLKLESVNDSGKVTLAKRARLLPVHWVAVPATTLTGVVAWVSVWPM